MSIKLHGAVKSGYGLMAKAMTSDTLRARFYSSYFGHLEPGTLNVQLAGAHDLGANAEVAHVGDNTVVLFQRCQVENLLGFIILPLGKFEKGTSHPVNLLEIISPFPLRRYLMLRDGSEITVSVTNLAEPSNEVKGRQ